MHSYPNSYASRLINLISKSELSVITNPCINSVLQGRYDDDPIRRGYTRICELQDAGVTVGIGQDDVMDAWYQYGDGDPLTAAFILLHYCFLNNRSQVDVLWNMMLDNNRTIYDDLDCGINEGEPASLVVYNEPDPFSALRIRGSRRLVLKDGNIISKTDPSRTTIFQGNEESEIDYYDI